MIYVLDTNAWSDAFRGSAKLNRKISTVPAARILLAAPVLYELRRAVPQMRAREWRKAIDELVSIYEVAQLDMYASEAAARIGLDLRRRGRTINHLDALVAGIASAREATLVSRDKDFSAVSGLHAEDWS